MVLELSGRIVRSEAANACHVARVLPTSYHGRGFDGLGLSHLRPHTHHALGATVLGCSVERIDEATHLIHAAAAALIAAEDVPPPWRSLYFRNGAAFAWVPMEPPCGPLRCLAH